MFNLLITIEESELYESFFHYHAFLVHLTSLLKDDGIMFFHYFWQTEGNILFDKIRKFFGSEEHISIMSFSNSAKKNNSKDSVMIYRKSCNYN